MEMAA